MNLRLLLILLVPISLFSCKKGGDDAHDAEMRKLNAWILVNNITVAPTASGMYFIPVDEGSGVSPVDGDYIYYNMSVETLDGYIVGSTIDSVADNWGLKNATTHYTPTLFKLDSKYKGQLNGLVEAALRMKEGEKARLILPSNLAFGSGGYSSVIGSNTTVVINFELVKVVKNISLYEKELVESYASLHGFNIPISDKVGVFYKDSIPKADSNVNKYLKNSAKSAKVWYVGRYLDGFVFDTNIKSVADSAGITASSTALLTVEFGKVGVIPAFEAVVKEMWIGQTTKLVTTSEFAYGAAGSGAIPSYTPLVFEITVDSYVIK